MFVVCEYLDYSGVTIPRVDDQERAQAGAPGSREKSKTHYANDTEPPSQ